MTDLDLAALRAAAEASTIGPWEWSRSATGGACVVAGHQGIAEVLSRAGLRTAGVGAVACEANAAFIAAARTAVPALLDRLAAAERERDEAQRLAGVLADAWQGRVVAAEVVTAAVEAVPEGWRP